LVAVGVTLACAAFPIALNPNAGAWVLAAALMLLFGVSIAVAFAFRASWRFRELSLSRERWNSCRESLSRALVVETVFVADAAWRLCGDDDDAVTVMYRVSATNFVFFVMDSIDEDEPLVPASWRLRQTLGRDPIMLASDHDSRWGALEAEAISVSTGVGGGTGGGLARFPPDGQLVSASELPTILGVSSGVY
jgi:hypothetical protein